MLTKDYYENTYSFIDHGIVIFDKSSKSLEYTNSQLLSYLNTNKESLDYNYCNILDGIQLKKSKITLKDEEKVIFTIIDDNMSKKLLNKGPMIIFTWMNEENWPATYVSENIEEILGYSVEEFIHGDLFYSDIIHRDDLSKVSEEVNEAIEKNKEYFYHEPYRIYCKDGEVIWISDFTVLVKDHKGKITGFHGYINNINELMKTRDALMEHERRSQEIIDAADLGTWEWDYETEKIKHNDKWFEMLGYEPNNYKDVDINALVSHPGDLKKAWIELRKHIDGKRDYYEIERRIKRKDDSFAWILDKGRIIEYSSDGQPKKIFGVHVDISQQKIIEEQFKLFMDSAEEIFIILNDALEIIEINEAGLLLMSKTVKKSEVIGKKIHNVFPFMKKMINTYKELNNRENQISKIKKYSLNNSNEFFEFNLFRINNDIGLIGHNITSSVLYQQSIEQMNDNFTQILSALAFGVVLVSQDRKVKWANDQAMKLFGIDSFDEIKGKHCQDFICLNNENRKCPLDGVSDFQTVECKVRNQKNQLVEVMKKATMIDYENEKVVLESFIDISNRKAIERKLEKETDRLKNIYRIANIGVFDFDFVKDEIYMNKNQYRILEIPIEVPQNELIRIIKKRVGYNNLDRIQEIPKNGKFSLELELKTPNKKKYVKIYGSTKSKQEDQFNRIIGACIDITDLKEAENKALLASQSKSTFLANMSHEIRTPLNGILGFTEALLETDLSSKQVDYLNTIKYSGNSLAEIIEDILNLSKIEAGKMALMEEFVDIEQIVSEAIDILKLEAYKKEIKLLYNINITEGSKIKLDPVRIKQVLINLLANAIKFTEKGFVKLKISIKDDDSSLFFEIIDSGIGISINDQRKIMESFYQGDPQITRKYGGTGLGLTITNRILNLMGSNLNVKSHLGQGSTFYFNLNTEIKSDVFESRKDLDVIVLIVDSDSISGISLKEKFEGVPQSTIIKSDLDEALDFVVTTQKNVKIFISRHYDYELINDFLKKIESIGKAFDVFLYAFELLNKDFIQKEFENLKYEFISRPLSRKRIIKMISGSDYSPKALDSGTIQTNNRVEILIAEDNSINMKLLKTFIKSYLLDANIHEAINGEEVLDILEEKKIDLIFMDIQMPLMDGIETTMEIRTFNESVPIIGLTALTQRDDEIKSKSIGMNDYISKPVSKQKIFNALKEWLNSK